MSENQFRKPVRKIPRLRTRNESNTENKAYNGEKIFTWLLPACDLEIILDFKNGTCADFLGPNTIFKNPVLFELDFTGYQANTLLN